MDDARRCKAKTSSSGYKERCKKPAIMGGTVCQSHGGGAPQVKAKARDRLEALVDPVITIWTKGIEKAEARNLELHPGVLRLTQLVMDRAGYGPRSELGVEVEDKTEGREWLAHLTPAERRLLLEVMEAGERRRQGEDVPCLAAGLPLTKPPKRAPAPSPEPDAVDL